MNTKKIIQSKQETSYLSQRLSQLGITEKENIIEFFKKEYLSKTKFKKYKFVSRNRQIRTAVLKIKGQKMVKTTISSQSLWLYK